MTKDLAKIKTTKEIIKEIAFDIAKEVCVHIEVMYPAAVEATPSTFLLSVKGSIVNNIMSAIEVEDETAIFKRLAHRKKFRRWYKSAFKGLNKKQTVED